MAKRRRILVYLLALVVLFLGALFYLNKFYLPIRLKGALTASIENATVLSAHIGSLDYNVLRGFVIKDLRLYEKDTNTEVFFCEDISFNLLFLPLFRKKKIIIPSIRLKSPHLNVTLDKDGKLNILQFLKFRKQGKRRFFLLVNKFSVADGRVSFTDMHLKPIYRKEIGEIDLKVSLGLLDKVDFTLSADILQETTKSKLNLKGHLRLVDKRGEAELTFIDLPLSEIKKYYRNLPFEIIDGTSPRIKATLEFSRENLNIKAHLPLQNIHIKRDAIELTADWVINPDISLSLKEKQKIYGYKGNILLQNTKIMGIPKIDEIQNLTGEILFDQNLLWAENLKMHIKDIPFLLKGKLKLTRPPYFELTATSAIDADTIIQILKDTAGELPLQLQGKIDFVGNLSGEIKKDTLLKYGGYVVLSGTTCNFKFLPEAIKDLNVRMDFSRDNITWKNASGFYRGIKFTSEGSITDFARPFIVTVLKSDNLNVETNLTILTHEIKINSLIAKYLDSTLEASGAVKIEDKNNPLLNITSSAELELKNLIPLFPENPKKIIHIINPHGLVKITATVKGKAKDYKDWQSDITLSSPEVSLYGIILNNLTSNITQNKHLLKTEASSYLYGGTLNLQAELNLNEEIPTYTSKVSLNNIDLSLLKNSFPRLKSKDYSGILNGSLYLNGRGAEKKSLKGTGSLSIIEGKLWELNLLKGLGNLIFIPTFQNIVFSEGSASFVVKNGVISTEDLILHSENLHLEGKGTLDLDGEVNLLVNATMNEGLLKRADDIRKITTAIFGGPGLSIEISGNIKKPKYTIKPVVIDPLKSLKNIKDLIFGE